MRRRRAQEIGEQRQRVLVGPVQVVEQQHHRPMRGDALDEPLDHGEGALAIDLGRQRLGRLGRGQLAQHREQPRQERQIVADGLGELRLLELALLHRALEQRGRAVDDRSRTRCR